MKTLLNQQLPGRIARWCLPLAVIIVVAASLAWSNEGRRQHKLGGAFIGSGGGIIWNCLQIPLDPDGKTAAIRVNVLTYGPDLAGLLESVGADTLTENVAEGEMISRDTWKYSFVSYGTKQGNPPQICMIAVMTGTGTWTGPDSFRVDYITDYYAGPANILGLPNADVNGDGFPDKKAEPFYSTQPGSATATHVPILKKPIAGGLANELLSATKRRGVCRIGLGRLPLGDADQPTSGELNRGGEL